MDTRKMAERVQVLLNEGMGMEEALQKVMDENRPTTRADRLNWISGCDNIAVLQEQAHKSHAKKSKAKVAGNEQTMAVYQTEIDACYKRIEVLRAKVSSENPLQDLIKLGAKPSSVVQYWLKSAEETTGKRYEDYLKRNELSKKAGKAACIKASKQLPEVFKKELAELGEAYLKNVVDRLKRGDQRILALVRKYNVVS